MHIKYSSIPAGSKFLPGISATRLRSIQKNEKDPKAAIRLLVYAMRKEGKSMRYIGNSLNKPYSTIRDWLVRAMQLGVNGRYDILNDGAPCKMNPEQIEQLRADLIAGPHSCGFESEVWTAPLLAQHIDKKFGVQYATVSMYDILHRMGFSYTKPHPGHPNAISILSIKSS